MTIGIVGLGLIGGSFAKAYSDNDEHKVLAYNRSKEVIQAAYNDKAILFGDRVAGLADQLFCTTAVDHHRIFADIRCHLCQIVNAKLRIQTKQNQIAVFDISFV